MLSCIFGIVFIAVTGNLSDEVLEYLRSSQHPWRILIAAS